MLADKLLDHDNFMWTVVSTHTENESQLQTNKVSQVEKKIFYSVWQMLNRRNILSSATTVQIIVKYPRNNLFDQQRNIIS
jgi:secreted trypsin-like serine protease